MAEAVLTLKHHDEARVLFGQCDQNLKKLCQSTGTAVVLRGNQIRISGPQDQVAICHDTLQQWRTNLHQESATVSSAAASLARSNRNVQMISQDTNRFANHVSDADHASDRSISELRTGRDKVGKIRPKTDGQQNYMDAMRHKELVFCDGPAGCGKTYLAVAMALEALRREDVRKIVLVRPAVEAGEKLGFLPGDMLAKVNPFLRPLLDAINDMLEFDQVRRYMSNDVIEVVPLAFMRGRTLNDTFMILDEGQNTTNTQMKMFLTRMGVNSRIVVTGDSTQNDLPKGANCGLLDGMQRLSGIGGVAIVRMSGQDIVRHRLVREIVSAYEADDETKSH
jgi:phosphate starvation-inducible protein PhoH and related proteins